MRLPHAAALIFFAAIGGEAAFAQQVADTAFTPDRGFYDAPLAVTISSPTPGAFISYTTDGSLPLASGGAASPVVVNIDRSTPLRALAYLPSGGLLPTNVDTHTYVIVSNPMRWNGKTYTTSAAYPAAVVDSLESLPALFIAMQPGDFATVRDSGSGGIGQSGANEQYERPCSAELWYPPNTRFAGFAGFQIDAGLRPHSWVTTKRAFRIYFKRQYGAGKLKYPIFESAPWAGESAVEQFDKLVLRHHSNDGWEGRWGGANEALYLRDQFARACQIDMGGPGSRSMWAHLFVNGAYYGLYSPCERPDDDFLASYLGGDDDDYLGFNHGGPINDGADETIYNAYRSPGNLGGSAAYEAFKGVLNPAQFSDYLVSSWFNTTHSHDWPVNGTRPQNFYGGNRNTPPAGTMHFTWDFEASLIWDSEVHDKFKSTSGDKTKEFIETWFALIENEDFIALFADRAFKHLHNGGALAQAQARQRLDAMAAHVQPALEAEKWQWGGGFDNWNTYIGLARGKLVTNPASLVASLRSENYYPPLDPPLLKLGAADITVDRLRVAGGTQITLSNSNGTTGGVRYSFDGSDPRDGGGLGGGDAHAVTVVGPTLIKARVQNGTTWSALRELSVIVPQDFSGLKISEVMYHPAAKTAAAGRQVNTIVGDADLGRARVDLASAPPATLRDGDFIRLTAASNPTNNGLFEITDVTGNSIFINARLSDETNSPAVAELLFDGDRYEFIELENTGGTALHLGAVEFSKGIGFAFAPDFGLGAGERAVVATRPWDFAARYPGVPVAGEFLRDLDNGGEKLELAQTDALHHEVLSLSTNAFAFGEIQFASLPPGAAAGNRVRITGCERVTNNGSYIIQSVLGATVIVNRNFVDAPAGALAQLFEVIDAVDYNDSGSWPRSADGVGYSLVREGAAWRASAAAGGSPGASDPAPPAHPALLVNEALTHTDLPQVDAVEIYNPTGGAASLAGWWLSDDLDEPNKFQIPAGAVAAGGYLVFDEADFGSVFQLGSNGDDIYLFSPDLRYGHGFKFGSAENGVSFGRHLTSTGAEHFVRQSPNTLGAANAGPRVGPAVITEIFYHPPDGEFEFLELTNVSASPLDVTDWGVSGFGFEFPPGTTLAPGEVVLVLEDPAAAPGAPAGTRTFLTEAKLSNGGERLRLRKLDGAGGWITIDEVDYDDKAPWPTSPDGGGFSLERIANSAYADDPANWRASTVAGGTPGASEPPTTPLIGFEPAALQVETLGGTDADAAAFEVWNVGIDSLAYTVADDAGWLSVSPPSGASQNATDRGSHAVTFDTDALAPGVYAASITISGNADNSPTVLPVTLTVRERDTTAPTLISAEASGVSAVTVTFSEPVLGGAEVPANYTLDGGVSVLAAVLSPDGTKVDLTTSPLVTETLYTLSVAGVSDRAEIPNTIAAGAGASFFYAGSSLPEGLVAHWRFDEGTGASASDEEGANNLSLQQSPSWVAGHDGTAIDLNGSNQYGTRGDSQLAGAFPSKSSGGATEFTMAAWIYLNGGGNRHAIMTKQGSETRGLLWSVEADNRLTLQLYKSQNTADKTDTSAGSALSLNRWYHVAVSYRFIGDGTSHVRLYVDGALAGSTDSAVGPPVANGVDFNIGRYWWSSGYSTYFDGRIDDFMVFDRELSAAEIGQVHSGATPSAATPQISPAGGEFVSPVLVALTSSTPDAEIYYTLDGSEPTAASTPYTAPFSVADSLTVRARTFAPGYVPSDASSATFTKVEASGDWWNTALAYRIPITVGAGSYPREDLHCAVVPVDLSAAVPDSVRVVEINALGNVIDPAVAFQFDAADGELVIALNGPTQAGATRLYHAYYATGGTFTPPAVSPLVIVDPDSTDGGFDSIRFVTPIGTWQYHKVGAGFSSLDDIDGNDWIGWSTAAGSDGAYRGIPNMAFNSGYFHPGGEGNPSTTTLATEGPVRSTLTSISEDGEWELRWDIYPAYAQLDVVRRDPSETYWFLYEGTPGGAIDLASDYSVRPDGTRLPLGTAWAGDLPNEEWVYVEDSALDRSIYIAQHQPDNNTDSYWQLNGDMTVLGFGRLNLNTYLSAAPNLFTVGLADDASFANMEDVIESAYRPLSTSAGISETIPAGAAYEAWARDRFGDAAVDDPSKEASEWGMLADPEGDGLINALEHITGLDPTAHDGADAFGVEVAAGGGLVFRFRLAKGELGWQSTAQFSGNLAAWEDLPGTPVLRADLGDAEIWEIALPDSDEAVFARLQASE